MSTPRFTALSPNGMLVSAEAGTVLFEDPQGRIGRTVKAERVYVPVAAFDPASGVGIVLYRDHETDAVWALTSTDQRVRLAEKTHGKWPLAVTRIGVGQFLAAWLEPGAASTATAVLDVTGGLLRVVSTARVTEPVAQTIMEIRNGVIRYDNIHEVGLVVRSFTRAGVTRALTYWREAGDYVVGCDIGPNRVLLGAPDGWFEVCADDPSVQFPATLDDRGNVAVFEGRYFPIAATRTHPLEGVPVPTPVPIPVPEPTPVDPCQAEVAALNVRLDLRAQDVAALRVERQALTARITSLEQTQRTDADVIRIVNNAAGRLPWYWQSAGVRGAIDKAVKAELRARGVSQ
jgi:hypothetical protein